MVTKSSDLNVSDTRSSLCSKKWIVALYLGLSLVTGAVSFNRPIKLEQAAAAQRQAWANFTHQEVANIDDRLSRAYATRILMPATIAGLSWIPGVSWERSFSLARLLSIFAAYVLFHYYLNESFSTELAMSGTLFMAATLPLTFNNWYEIPTDFPEIVTFTVGIWCLQKNRHALLYLVIFIGTLNRETTVFLVLMYLFYLSTRDAWVEKIPQAAMGVLMWLIPMILLKWWTGVGVAWTYYDSISHNAAGITQFFGNANLYNNFLFYIYLFGVFWLLPFLSWREQPIVLQRCLIAVPFILVSCAFAGGFLDEPREIVCLYPVLVPAGLHALYSRKISQFAPDRR